MGRVFFTLPVLVDPALLQKELRLNRVRHAGITFRANPPVMRVMLFDQEATPEVVNQIDRIALRLVRLHGEWTAPQRHKENRDPPREVESRYGTLAAYAQERAATVKQLPEGGV